MADGSKDDVRSITSDEDQRVVDYKLAKARTRRTIRALDRYDYAKLIAYYLVAASEVIEDEPSSVSSTLASKEKTQWLNVMNEEMKSHHLHNTWTLVCRP